MKQVTSDINLVLEKLQKQKLYILAAKKKRVKLGIPVNENIIFYNTKTPQSLLFPSDLSARYVLEDHTKSRSYCTKRFMPTSVLLLDNHMRFNA